MVTEWKHSSKNSLRTTSVAMSSLCGAQRWHILQDSPPPGSGFNSVQTKIPLNIHDILKFIQRPACGKKVAGQPDNHRLISNSDHFSPSPNRVHLILSASAYRVETNKACLLEGFHTKCKKISISAVFAFKQMFLNINKMLPMLTCLLWKSNKTVI